MTNIVGKLWGFCHTLRHDRIDYGDYIEQLTYLLFLKMAEEKGAAIPSKNQGSGVRTLILQTSIVKKENSNAKKATNNIKRGMRTL